jgi:hypothetical protein
MPSDDVKPVPWERVVSSLVVPKQSKPKAKRPPFLIAPASEETMAHYRNSFALMHQCASELGFAEFSPNTRASLRQLIDNQDSLLLLEVIARCGEYGNHNEHESMRKRVSQLLQKRGVRLSKGKRTKPGLERLVKDLAPLLLRLGLPGASGKDSKLVNALRLIAKETGVEGDPRDELRRINEIEVQFRLTSRKAAREITLKALREVFSSA